MKIAGIECRQRGTVWRGVGTDDTETHVSAWYGAVSIDKSTNLGWSVLIDRGGVRGMGQGRTVEEAESAALLEGRRTATRIAAWYRDRL